MKLTKSLIVCIGLYLAACVGLSQNAFAEELSPILSQNTVSDDQISKWVEDHPDAIIKSINTYMAKQQPSLTEFILSADQLIDEKHPSLGAPISQADVIIVEFSDFNCRYCKEAEEPIHTKMETQKGVHIIYRDISFLHPSSEGAALAAKAADLQGKYREFRSALFAAQKQAGFTEDDLKSIARNIGLDVAKWDADRSSDYLKGLIKEDMELVSKLRIGGTPFFFGWMPLTKYALISQGAVTEESFESILNELRSSKAM
ncbi:DsbA family protein [Azospirillum brasilense]|uniref:DsbA family protein n=1 Tax=Azospirillum brasilense TaxID=192 RepID=UPI0013B46CFB|nr:DsbA family protein [Azospirillum brasilense]